MLVRYLTSEYDRTAIEFLSWAQLSSSINPTLTVQIYRGNKDPGSISIRETV